MTTATPNSSGWPFISDGRDHAGERHHRADREVDPAGDDDDRLGDRGEGEGQDRDGEALDAGRRRSSAGSAW